MTICWGYSQNTFIILRRFSFIVLLHYHPRAFILSPLGFFFSVILGLDPRISKNNAVDLRVKREDDNDSKREDDNDSRREDDNDSYYY